MAIHILPVAFPMLAKAAIVGKTAAVSKAALIAAEGCRCAVQATPVAPTFFHTVGKWAITFAAITPIINASDAYFRKRFYPDQPPAPKPPNADAR